MKVLLTFDLELFFGSPTGSVQKCMVEPTKLLMALAKKHQVKLNFFWDVGHYLALQKWAKEDAEAQKDLEIVEQLMKRIAEEGHDIQLHIHPHWEKANREKGQWVIETHGCYRLHDFDEATRKNIFSKYALATSKFAANEVNTFRAGGWCIQPFEDIKSSFVENKIKIDSSVMRGAKLDAGAYYYDFTEAPSVDVYPFEEEIDKAHNGGSFLELPITTNWFSPLFFWRLYVLGRLFPSKHKPFGDGNFISQPGVRNQRLLKGQHFHASTDGYFANKLVQIFNRKRKDFSGYMVTIGHPKSLTPYALKKLDKFIAQTKHKAEFIKYSEVK